jgi:hypothetical protein
MLGFMFLPRIYQYTSVRQIVRVGALNSRCGTSGRRMLSVLRGIVDTRRWS